MIRSGSIHFGLHNQNRAQLARSRMISRKLMDPLSSPAAPPGVLQSDWCPGIYQRCRRKQCEPLHENHANVETGFGFSANPSVDGVLHQCSEQVNACPNHSRNPGIVEDGSPIGYDSGDTDMNRAEGGAEQRFPRWIKSLNRIPVHVQIFVQAQRVAKVPEERVDTIEPSRPPEASPYFRAPNVEEQQGLAGRDTQQPSSRSWEREPVKHFPECAAHVADSPFPLTHVSLSGASGLVRAQAQLAVASSVGCSIVKEQSTAVCAPRAFPPASLPDVKCQELTPFPAFPHRFVTRHSALLIS